MTLFDLDPDVPVSEVPVLGSWLWLPAGDDREVARLVRQFTIVPRALGARYSFSDAKPAKATVAIDRSREGMLGVPRAAGMAGRDLAGEEEVGDLDVEMVDGVLPIDESLFFRGELRGRQPEAVQALVTRSVPGCILEALPGKGKTVMLLAVAAQCRVRTLVLVNSELLMKQWVKRAVEFLGLAPEQVGIAQQNRMGGFGKALTIGMVQSVVKHDGYTSDWRRCFGLVIYDECDLVPTEIMGRALPMFPATRRIAATATLDRADGMTKLLDWHVGPVAVSMMEPDVVPDVYVLPNRREYPAKAYSWMEYDNPADRVGRRRVNYTKLQQILANDEARNRAIVEQVGRAYAAGRTSLVLTHHREHALRLQQWMTLWAKVPASAVGLVTGDVKREADIEAGLAKPVIVATYKMMGRGIDVPAIDAEFFALPVSDVRQALGRSMRLVEGKKTPTVVDTVDMTIFDCRNLFRGRRRFYEQINAGGNWRGLDVDEEPDASRR